MTGGKLTTTQQPVTQHGHQPFRRPHGLRGDDAKKPEDTEDGEP